MAGSGTAQLRDRGDILLRVEHLGVEFPAGHRQKVHAVSDVSFDLARGEVLGLVGESGCGKSTTGRAVLRLIPPTTGTVRFDGTTVTAIDDDALRKLRPLMQIIFQDPISSLNPRRTVLDLLSEPLKIWGRYDRRGSSGEEIGRLLLAVGLDAESIASRRPASLSGGQAQRLCIARALVLRPDLLICDEPVSALDVSVQAQIINLLKDLRVEYGLTIIFIAHDLAVVRNISDRLAVMYLGKLCEIGDAGTIYSNPAHPYTQALLASVPAPDPSAPPIVPPLSGEVASPVTPPSGCRFRTRCPRATGRCDVEEPAMRPAGRDRFVACHHPLVDADAGLAVGSVTA